MAIRLTKPLMMKAVLLTSVTAQALVAYFVPVSNYRTGVILMLVAPIVWGASGIGVVERIMQILASRPYRRRYLRLRKLLDRLITDVRRMNAVALEQRQGLKDPEVTRYEMDQLEAQMIALIKEMRRAAGEVSEAAESEANKPLVSGQDGLHESEISLLR